MFASVYDELQARGFVEQVSDEEELKTLLNNEKISCYIGFDPTADSLHVGSLVPLMALHHMQRYGHRPIAILGGGTAMVGDPSGKTEMRKMLTREQIEANAEKIKQQIARFIDFQEGLALVLDNAEWLLDLKYIDFLRDIGRHFSVNRMLAAEAYKIRLETGLSFLEFNYQLLQAYDYLILYRHYDCRLQMGGNDQWGNILAGTELIRRVEGGDAYALTFPLLTTASGQKMGKTAEGAVWLDPQKTSPYDFYQYWVNTDDRDVIRFMKLFTVLPLDVIAEYEKLQGEALREAKRKLAYEVTKFVHGPEEAERAAEAARALFEKGEVVEGVPETEIPASEFEQGFPVATLFARVGLTKSSSEARRLIKQGGVYINGERIRDEQAVLTREHMQDGAILLRAGKKRYHRVRLV